MGSGIQKALIGAFGLTAGKVPETRKGSNAQVFTIADALKSGLAVFYFQHPSLLDFQKEMEKKKHRNNLQTLFGVEKSPCTQQIKNIVDDVEPAGLSGVFDAVLREADERGIIEEYRVLDGGCLVPMDGVWYFSSKEIHCDHCLSMTKKNKKGEDETTYYHDAVTLAIVRPDCPVVLPLMPELIRNEDGQEKQDCERNAAKRLLDARGEALLWLKPTFLGDDIYCCHEICKKVLGIGANFIFTCKPGTHKWVEEQVKYWDCKTATETEWTGKYHIIRRYSWANGIENRCDGERLTVNYLYMEEENQEKSEVTFRNSWMTTHTITEQNAAFIGKCARARWKIENEHNNVLKHHGYNLKHNFGHGENHASEIFLILHLISFLFHGIQDIACEDYQRARAYYSSRVAFFNAMRTVISLMVFTTWHDFLIFIAGAADDG
jgi:hypothetical protein